jgi:branched-chain amino acid transport system substrate-binding protein
MLRVGLALVAGFFATTALAQEKVRGVTKNEVVLGMHTDLSGVAAIYGVSTRNAMQIRFDEVNAAGGVHGRKIKLIVEDSQYQVPRAVQAANKLLNRDNIFAMIGGAGTPMNNAVLPDQLKLNVPNLFPLSWARQMSQPFHKLKFAAYAPYYDQIRAGVKWMAENRGKKNLCALYQDTDFGQEIFEGVRDQAQAMNLKLAETATNKPADTDLSAQITRLKAANCDVVFMGTIIRDTIIAYSTARKAGWNDVDFVGQQASCDYPISAAPGGATEGFYAMCALPLPYRDTANPEAAAFLDKYKQRYNSDIGVGALFGLAYADLTVLALDRAGPNLTVDTLVKGLESISGYKDIFGGPTQSFGPDKRLGTRSSALYQVKSNRWVSVTDPIAF